MALCARSRRDGGPWDAERAGSVRGGDVGGHHARLAERKGDAKYRSPDDCRMKREILV